MVLAMLLVLLQDSGVAGHGREFDAYGEARLAVWFLSNFLIVVGVIGGRLTGFLVHLIGGGFKTSEGRRAFVRAYLIGALITLVLVLLVNCDLFAALLT